VAQGGDPEFNPQNHKKKKKKPVVLKGTGGVASVVEHLPSKWECEILSSNPSIAKTKKYYRQFYDGGDEFNYDIL
jgi:hypothetical protein